MIPVWLGSGALLSASSGWAKRTSEPGAVAFRSNRDEFRFAPEFALNIRIKTIFLKRSEPLLA
jgi:hypothetical protein